MNRHNSSSDSLLSSFSISSSSPTDMMHFADDCHDIQAMLESLDEEDQNEMENPPSMGKKKRLNLTQVRALEMHFEADNKLEPERKKKLALELGLQPRQVAVWFQNRRARWKNKRLEKEYEVLKTNYEELKKSYENAGREKEALNAQLRELKLRLVETSENESENPNNIVIYNESIVDYGQPETWSCSSSSLMQLDFSAFYPPENPSWFHHGNGVPGEESGPGGQNWFNFELDH